jgi:MFS family permease
MKRFQLRHILLIIALCGMLCNCLGVLFNVAGLFFNPIADEFGIGRGDVSVAHTIASLGCAVGGILGARAAKTGRFRLILIVCTALFAGGTALLTLTRSIWPMYVISAFRGLGAGAGGTVLVTIVINNWFTGKVGLLTSLVFCSAGVGGAILSPILSSVIERSGWRAGYLVMAAVIALLYLPGIVFRLGIRPEDAGSAPLRLGSDEPASPAKAQTSPLTAPDTKIDPALYVLILIYACIASSATAYIPHFSGIADSYGQTAAVGSAMVSAAMVSNTAGKLVYGALTDRVGLKKGIWIWGLLVIAGIVMMLRMRSPAALYAAAFLVGMCYSLSSVGTALLSRDIFGTQVHARAYPSINMINTVANAGVTALIGFLYDASGSYSSSLLLFLAGEIVLMLSASLAYRRCARLKNS